jgi:hypothetical protein
VLLAEIGRKFARKIVENVFIIDFVACLFPSEWRRIWPMFCWRWWQLLAFFEGISSRAVLA